MAVVRRERRRRNGGAGSRAMAVSGAASRLRLGQLPSGGLPPFGFLSISLLSLSPSASFMIHGLKITSAATLRSGFWYSSGSNNSNISSPDDVDINSGYPLQELMIVENAASKGALCLDGTPPAYHLSERFGPRKGNSMVYFLGSAWFPIVSDCLARMNGHLGSSTKWNNTKTIQRFEGILYNSSKFNPDFRSWTKVMARYCDGSSFTGDVDPITGLHFRGKRVFDAIVDDLLFSKGMKDAKEVLFTSGFAGELAVIIYYDRFANHFPNTTNVKCLSDGGFFLLSNNPLQA
ncbi:pectin acetylesterase 8-like [Ipomoea triloba]|uniref:pectin acetylesterase 8-like n=1 Tax=Ipomoea triloba TaxID=35885 RepID=UPI00125E8CEC|nr:pectin acetylesterase 8-like [Ipomoea triloba]